MNVISSKKGSPLHDAGDEQDGEAQQRGGDGVHADRAAEDPQAHRDGKGEGRDLLVSGQGACAPGSMLF